MNAFCFLLCGTGEGGSGLLHRVPNPAISILRRLQVALPDAVVVTPQRKESIE